MLCDVVRRRRRRRWTHAPVIHAAGHFDHKKRVAWVPFLCIRVVPFSIIMGLRSGRRSSAMNKNFTGTLAVIFRLSVNSFAKFHNYDCKQCPKLN